MNCIENIWIENPRQVSFMLSHELQGVRTLRAKAIVFERYGLELVFTGKHPCITGITLKGKPFKLGMSLTPSDGNWAHVISRDVYKKIVGIW